MLKEQIDDIEGKLKAINDFKTLVQNLHQTANNFKSLLQQDGNSQLITLKNIASSTRLDRILSATDITFVFGTNLYSEWAEKYFQLLHSALLENELVSEEERRGDTDAKIIKLDTPIDFGSTSNSAEVLSDRLERLVCQLYGIYKDEALKIQQTVRLFGLLDGTTTLCPTEEYENDPIRVPKNKSSTEPKPTMQVVSDKDKYSEQNPKSVEDIYSIEGDENEIFTYTYNYDMDA